MNKKLIAALVSLIIGIALFAYVVSQIKIGPVYRSLQQFSIWIFLLYLFVSLVIHGIKALRWKLVISTYGHRINYFKIFSYYLCAYPVNYLAPTHVLGEPVRANILSRRENISATHSFSTVLIDKAVEVFVDLAIAFILIVVLIAVFAKAGQVEVLLILAAVLFFCLLFFMYYRISKGLGIFAPFFRATRLNKIKKLAQFEGRIIDVEKNMMSFFRHDRKMATIALCMTALNWILMMGEYYIAIRLIGMTPSFVMIVLVIAAVYVSFAIPVPAALGTLELSQHSVFSLLDIKSSAFVLTMLIRARDMAIVLLGIVLLFSYSSSAGTLFGWLSSKPQELASKNRKT